MKYYAVIDTNVIVSAMLNPDSVPGSILRYAIAGIIVPLLNIDIFNEYCDVLNRKCFAFNQEEINPMLDFFREKGIMANRTETIEEFVDKKDVVFYEIALTGRAMSENSYLITGNLKHFPKKFFIISPREMLSIIDDDDDDNWGEYLAEGNETDAEKLAYIINSTGGGITTKKGRRIIHLYCLGVIDYETAVFALKNMYKK